MVNVYYFIQEGFEKYALFFTLSLQSRAKVASMYDVSAELTTTATVTALLWGTVH